VSSPTGVTGGLGQLLAVPIKIIALDVIVVVLSFLITRHAQSEKRESGREAPGRSEASL
jgi:ABC-type uncharacterized transport system YnjBCD substrate-binding protein